MLGEKHGTRRISAETTPFSLFFGGGGGIDIQTTTPRHGENFCHIWLQPLPLVTQQQSYRRPEVQSMNLAG
jgi:hypothetical protein